MRIAYFIKKYYNFYIFIYYMKNNTTSNSVFVLVISLFIIIFIVISYFVLSDSMFNINSNSNNNNNNNNNSNNNRNNNSNNYNYNSDTECVNKEEVFHLRDNIYDYEDAKAACKAYNSRLATLNELIDSYKKGANWCSYGWSEGQLALFPTQKDFWMKLQNSNKKNECGVPGVNGGYFYNKNYQFGANCYGNKPSAKKNEIINQQLNQREDPLRLKIDKYASNIKSEKLVVAPFNEYRWFQ